jgi:hypothetical protein
VLISQDRQKDEHEIYDLYECEKYATSHTNAHTCKQRKKSKHELTHRPNNTLEEHTVDRKEKKKKTQSNNNRKKQTLVYIRSMCMHTCIHINTYAYGKNTFTRKRNTVTDGGKKEREYRKKREGAIA